MTTNKTYLQVKMYVENVNDEVPTFTSDMADIRNLKLKENYDNNSLFLVTAVDKELNLPLTIFIEVTMLLNAKLSHVISSSC
jgi:hypothetical protein